MTLANFATAVRNGIADVLADAADAGTGAVGGKLRIYTAAFATLLVEIILDDPAFGAASSGIATAASLPITSEAAVADGTAAVGRYTDKDDTVLCTFAVGSDLVLSNTAIATSDTIDLTAFTLTAPA